MGPQALSPSKTPATGKTHMEEYAESLAKFTWKRKPSNGIYFIEAIGTGIVKIGLCTGNPKARLVALQNGCPFELRIIGHMSGDCKTEKEMHRRFKAQHVRGEWFRKEGPVRTAIEDCASTQN